MGDLILRRMAEYIRKAEYITMIIQNRTAYSEGPSLSWLEANHVMRSTEYSGTNCQIEKGAIVSDPLFDQSPPAATAADRTVLRIRTPYMAFRGGQFVGDLKPEAVNASKKGQVMPWQKMSTTDPSLDISSSDDIALHSHNPALCSMHHASRLSPWTQEHDDMVKGIGKATAIWTFQSICVSPITRVESENASRLAVDFLQPPSIRAYVRSADGTP
ncbi:hypothetical protein NOR_03487 [Metarhizium rileyi]|uniref:Uncharacterized protein n=1 Tax=Metarhizium rileyi (strain RCEF 4871) TaxID=1649241 RepID=A0A162JKR2_METRR|nr:hypothetical protein NOR_03487 [Metarhizium rileyi RCEF 4871]